MSVQSTGLKKPVSHEEKLQFWNTHIQDQEHSGLAQRVYCQNHGLGYASFTRWRGLSLKARKASKKPGTPPKTTNQLVPVQLVSATPASTVTYEHSVDLVLRDGTRIEGITDSSLSVAAALISQL